jgi:LysR family transcriptional regulator, transcription activator of glutamate synthase operon
MKRRGLKLQWLEGLVAAGRHKNLGMAAEELGVSTSAVTQRLQHLQTYLDVKLYEGDTSGVELTNAGEELLAFARAIVDNVNAAEGAMRDRREQGRRVLRVGHSPGHRELAVAAVSAVLAQRSDWRARVEEWPLSTYIEGRVREGSLDIAIIHGSRTQSEDVKGEPIAQPRLQLVVHATHRLAGGKPIEKLAELKGERFVLTGGNLPSRQTMNGYFKAHDNFQPKVVVETTGITAMLAFVRKSPKLVAVVPLPAPDLLHLEAQDLAVVELPEPCETYPTLLVWRSPGTEPHSEPARLFRRELLALLKAAPGKKA